MSTEYDNLEKLFKMPDTTHLYKTHPHFDKYPRYMQDALIANERMQGRMPK